MKRWLELFIPRPPAGDASVIYYSDFRRMISIPFDAEILESAREGKGLRMKSLQYIRCSYASGMYNIRAYHEECKLNPANYRNVEFHDVYYYAGTSGGILTCSQGVARGRGEVLKCYLIGNAPSSETRKYWTTVIALLEKSRKDIR